MISEIVILRPLAILLIALCAVHSGQSEQLLSKPMDQAPIDLEGVYEFVSETTILTKPSRSTTEKKYPEWRGITQLQKGYFSFTLMQEDRNDFLNSIKKGDVGFLSSAGRYEVEGKKIIFTQDIALRPFEVRRPLTMTYQLNKDTLVLTEVLKPHVEDIREGIITTVLRRIK